LISLCKSAKKPDVAYACHDREHIHALHQRFSADFQVLSLAEVVHAKTQSAPDFLPLCSGVIGMLQGANLEYIRVIPAFTQSRVREDKPRRFLK
jgi:hypothetical protein